MDDHRREDDAGAIPRMSLTGRRPFLDRLEEALAQPEDQRDPEWRARRVAEYWVFSNSMLWI